MTTTGAFEAAVAARIARREAAVARAAAGPDGTFEDYVSARIARAATATEAWQRTAGALARIPACHPGPRKPRVPRKPRKAHPPRSAAWHLANSRVRRQRYKFIASILETIAAHGIDPDVAITALEQLPTRRERSDAAIGIASDCH